MNVNVILPMAGHGRRFRDAGYTFDKPLIPVRGRNMIEWALEGIPATWTRTAVLRADQQDVLGAMRYYGMHAVVLPGGTEGAACTTLAAVVGLPPGQPVLVANCDQFVRFVEPLERVVARMTELHLDGAIFTFKASDPKWSYVTTGDDALVTSVVEKRVVSEDATCGLYLFARASDLTWACCNLVATNERFNREFYLAPCVNGLIRTGARFAALPVAEMVGLGTPEDVAAYEARGLC